MSLNIQKINNFFLRPDNLDENIILVIGSIKTNIYKLQGIFMRYGFNLNSPLTDELYTLERIRIIQQLFNDIYTNFSLPYLEFLFNRLYDYLEIDTNKTKSNYTNLMKNKELIKTNLDNFNKYISYLNQILNNAKSSANREVVEMANSIITYELGAKKTIEAQIRESGVKVKGPREDQPMPEADEENPAYQEYKTKLFQRIICPVCMNNERNTALGCGHMVCSGCFDIIDTGKLAIGRKCPICKQPIESKKSIYFNKYLKYKNKYAMLKNKVLQQ
jgi:hypothetical protein